MTSLEEHDGDGHGPLPDSRAEDATHPDPVVLAAHTVVDEYLAAGFRDAVTAPFLFVVGIFIGHLHLVASCVVERFRFRYDAAPALAVPQHDVRGGEAPRLYEATLLLEIETAALQNLNVSLAD